MTSRHSIVVITNGNFFAVVGLAGLLRHPVHGRDVTVLITRSLARVGHARFPLRILRRWGLRYTAFKVLTNALLPLVLGFLGRDGSVQQLCRRAGIATYEFRDVNSAGAIECIRALDPTLIVSFSCPYRLLAGVLELSRVGCLNVHSSLLPAYAGVSTYVHVLAHGEPITGVTVHEMVEKFDAGVILEQAVIEIPPKATAFGLFLLQCQLASDLLLRSVERVLSEGVIRGEDQDLSTRSYFGDPSRKEVVALRSRGFKLVRYIDLYTLLFSSNRRPPAS